MLDWYQAYDKETFLHRFSEIDYNQYNILALNPKQVTPAQE